MTPIDSYEFEVAAIKSFDAPKNVDVGVGSLKIVELTPKDAGGRTLHAQGAVHWNVSREEVARFFDSVRNATTTSTSGTRVQVRGLAPGMATLHGVYEQTKLDVVVNVN
jgi:hypothetical protein